MTGLVAQTFASDHATGSLGERRPRNSSAALRGLLIGLGLIALASLAGIAIASATFGYPIGRLA